MTGMGATLTPAAFASVRRNPGGVLIGLASQFGWMPLLAFGLARLFELPPELALGLVIVGCTPGGTTSNMFTYFARADLALSICMTVASTVVAVGMMPLLLFLYTPQLGAGSLNVPYGSIATTLALVLVPVALGLWIRSRSERVARRVERAGSLCGLAVLLLIVAASSYRNSDDFFEIPLAHSAAAALLGLLGMGLGYMGARLLGLAPASQRAVALETGIQNSALAFGIILSSFPEAQQRDILRLPLSYAFLVLVNASLVTLWFRRSSQPEALPEAVAS